MTVKAKVLRAAVWDFGDPALTPDQRAAVLAVIEPGLRFRAGFFRDAVGDCPVLRAFPEASKQESPAVLLGLAIHLDRACGFGDLIEVVA